MSRKQNKNKKNLLLEILKNSYFLKGNKIGLAVSGGVDSVVLLDIFNKLKNKYDLNLYVLHYNHKWRKTSSVDTKLVRNYCQKNKIKFLYEESKENIIKNEEHARNQRYSFFKDCAKKHDLKFICTAHHKDDHVETILFRLARGTGPKGLFPIKELSNLSNKTKLCRPFLQISKEQIYLYAKKNKLIYIDDETNNNLKYKRNLIRAKVLPNLKMINKEYLNNILACSNLVYSQNVALDGYFSKLVKNLSTSIKPISLYRNKFLKLDEYTQKAFIYWFLGFYKIKGSVSKINVLSKIIKDKGKIDLSKEYALESNDNLVCLRKKRSEERIL